MVIQKERMEMRNKAEKVVIQHHHTKGRKVKTRIGGGDDILAIGQRQTVDIFLQPIAIARRDCGFPSYYFYGEMLNQILLFTNSLLLPLSPVSFALLQLFAQFSIIESLSYSLHVFLSPSLSLFSCLCDTTYVFPKLVSRMLLHFSFELCISDSVPFPFSSLPLPISPLFLQVLQTALTSF